MEQRYNNLTIYDTPMVALRGQTQNVLTEEDTNNNGANEQEHPFGYASLELGTMQHNSGYTRLILPETEDRNHRESKRGSVSKGVVLLIVLVTVIVALIIITMLVFMLIDYQMIRGEEVIIYEINTQLYNITGKLDDISMKLHGS